MKPRPRLGYRGLMVAIAALLVIVVTAGCSDLPGTGTTAGGDTTINGATTLPPAVTTTVTGEVVTTTTVAPVTTLAPGTTLPPAVTVTTEALSSAEELLPNGHIKAMGYIDDAWESGGVRHIRIDYAEMLTGAAADAAAVAAGLILPGEHADNDYFISNVNPLMREFVVSNTVAITTSTRWAPHDGMGAPCSWGAFITFWGGMGPLPQGDTQLHAVPWWIERDGPVVIKIDEQYLP